MAPEVCGGEETDARSDLYAVGASIYFMLTASALFPDRSVTEVIMMQISKMPEPPSSLVLGVPADLERVVMKCLAKHAADRYQTIEELDRALAACADASRWSGLDASTWWSSLPVTTTARRRRQRVG
jgi:serine/threonine-protein kinase